MIRNFGAFVEIEVSDKVNFGMLITIWLSITELLSILENRKGKVMVWVSVGIMFWMAV